MHLQLSESNLDLPTIVIPAIAYNLLICGLAAAAGYHVLTVLQGLSRRLKNNRNP